MHSCQVAEIILGAHILVGGKFICIPSRLQIDQDQVFNITGFRILQFNVIWRISVPPDYYRDPLL